jgi:hypothetical protein
MLTAQIITVLTLIYVVCVEFVNPVYKLDRLKRYTMALCVYCLILTNANDLIISGFFVLNSVIIYIFEEILFFVRNLKDIKKILNYYISDDKKILKTYSKRLKSSNEYVFITRGE